MEGHVRNVCTLKCRFVVKILTSAHKIQHHCRCGQMGAVEPTAKWKGLVAI